MRIAITGPESCGKSTLTAALAEALDGVCVTEFARTYLEQNGGEYDFDDLEFMALGHRDAFLNETAPIVVVDTDFIGFKVWSEFKYETTCSFIHQSISEAHFDLHILCAPDIPWEPDPLRENPNDRHELFNLFIENLERYKKEYIIVYGNHDQRLKKSEEAARRLLRNL